ncbi:penicillin-binding protein 2 [Ornithinibacillus sp. L9]|uniref:serine-type D-Ala-D-Ala carboxypeptidase n=1 Tax=Ornithinibacillus caprae TaxID=2678566 RepID=A0A6N8FEK5_9BACI|nr:penicillin-binding protein 2 [Ornithinibacillus caprae]MUK87116.1 penicillin-binding protein 2 [Ornithinibacillus caprae]
MKKTKKKRAQLPFRLNILFFIVFLLFSVLILQLGVVQILNGESFQEEIDRTIQDTTKIPVPRGKMYDRFGNVIVDNKPLYAITYTPPKGVQAKDKLDVAEKLSQYISMLDNCEGIEDSSELEACEYNRDKQLKSITERNKKEYWYLKNQEEADSRLSLEEAAEMSNSDAYNETLKRITEDEISNFTEEELEVILIKKELDKAYSLTPQIVKNENVTPEEYAQVAEHLDELPGINASTDWNREYPYDVTFKNILGSITTQDTGILADKEQYYLTRGYSRNDRVGQSGLEEQYEEVLRGRKEQIKYTTSKNGSVLGVETVVQGERGKDLVLTVDMEFQQRVDDILRKELNTAISEQPSQNQHLEDALAVVLDPQTGEILAISGQRYDRDEREFQDVSFRTLYDAHRPGSTIKGATILAGFESGAISPGYTIYDSPVVIKGSSPKSSLNKNIGTVDDRGALKYSSNVYMFHTAMRIGGQFNFKNGDPLVFQGDYFQRMRNYFYQLGLGVKTGIDFPYEATGYVGESRAGQLLDYAIGQYDTYTTIQLAQYVATIANDGYRVRPHFLKEIRMPEASDEQLGPVYRSVNTEVLNRIDMSEAYIDRVQEGFRQVFQEQGGTAYSTFGNKDYDPVGKTGTAENDLYKDGKRYETINLTMVAYAPSENPEIAVAVVVPNLGLNNNHPINRLITEGIMDSYFELQEERANGDTSAKDVEEGQDKTEEADE